jgi:hypothetical protein
LNNEYSSDTIARAVFGFLKRMLVSWMTMIRAGRKYFGKYNLFLLGIEFFHPGWPEEVLVFFLFFLKIDNLYTGAQTQSGLYLRTCR